MSNEIKKTNFEVKRTNTFGSEDLRRPDSRNDSGQNTEPLKVRYQLPDLKINPARNQLDIASSRGLNGLKPKNPSERTIYYREAFTAIGYKLLDLAENNPGDKQTAREYMWQLESLRQQYRRDFPFEKEFPA